MTDRTCDVPDCHRPHKARGLCRLHDYRQRKNGTTELPSRPTQCVIDGCDGKVRAWGWCIKHYARWRSSGDPLATRGRPVSYCNVANCEARVEGYGLCAKHLRRKRKFGSFDLPDKPTECAIEGCSERPVGRGWCRKHYSRWWAHGNPFTVLPNPMNLPRPPKPCKVRGCNGRHSAKGLCAKHYSNAYKRKWRRDNPDKAWAKYQRRRKLVRNAAVNDLTARQWREIKVSYRHRCAYCGKRRPLTMDHVVPLSKGGPHTASNIIPACRPCNGRKCDREAPTYQPLLF